MKARFALHVTLVVFEGSQHDAVGAGSFASGKIAIDSVGEVVRAAGNFVSAASYDGVVFEGVVDGGHIHSGRPAAAEDLGAVASRRLRGHTLDQLVGAQILLLAD